VIANDIQYYSFVLNKQYIENHRPLKFKKLEEILPQLKDAPIENRKTAVCEFLSNLKGAKGFIYKNYCAGGTKGKEHERQYFSDDNGKKCDAIRIKIEEWKNNKLINDYNGLKKLDTDLAKNRWKDMIKYDQENASRKSASCVSRH